MSEGVERSRTDHTVRSSVLRASLWKMMMTDAVGSTDAGRYFSFSE